MFGRERGSAERTAQLRAIEQKQRAKELRIEERRPAARALLSVLEQSLPMAIIAEACASDANIEISNEVSDDALRVTIWKPYDGVLRTVLLDDKRGRWAISEFERISGIHSPHCQRTSSKATESICWLRSPSGAEFRAHFRYTSWGRAAWNFNTVSSHTSGIFGEPLEVLPLGFALLGHGE